MPKEIHPLRLSVHQTSFQTLFAVQLRLSLRLDRIGAHLSGTVLAEAVKILDRPRSLLHSRLLILEGEGTGIIEGATDLQAET